MMLPRRFVAPLAVSGLLFALWFSEGALCSCGGASAPAVATVESPALAPAVVPVASEAPATAPAALPDLSDPSWIRTPSAANNYLFVWRPVPAPIARNEDFALDLWIFAGDEPRHVTGLDVSGWMPDHGHGMLRTVRAEAQPDGSYRVENMLLHMRGHWLLVFDVLDGTVSERAEHSLEL